MKTYTINNQKELEKFKDEYGYEVNGNLIANCPIDITGRLLVSGFIKADYFIKASGYIKASGFIKAGEYIKVGEYIKAGWHIEAGGSIQAGWYIQAGEYIKAGWYIKVGEYIKAGDAYGISAGLYITCKGELKYGLKCFAGICAWREITNEEKTITCGKHSGGTIEYGILKETGIKDTLVGSEVEVKVNGRTYKAVIKESER
jgi:hypothetical protein